MRGIHTIELYDKRVHYKLVLKRNITVITGDSATGKSTIVRMLSRYSIAQGKGYIKLTSDVPVYAFPVADMATDLQLISSLRNSILILDESAFYMTTKEFAQIVSSSTCYFVLITREPLPMLPYSVEEVYDLHSSRTNEEDARVFHTMNKLYHSLYNHCSPTCICTEDSNSGFDFFHSLCNCKVISAGGISNIAKKILDTAEETAFVIDGAAAGAFIRTIVKAADTCGQEICVWADESFEYLLLRSGIIHDQEIQKILDAPEEYIDSELYFSWERFFTNLLVDKSRNTVLAYTKKQLPSPYLEPANAKRVWNLVPDGLNIPHK